MRGLLGSMMQQAHKVELFKTRQCPANSLHAKYATGTGLTVVGDHEVSLRKSFIHDEFSSGDICNSTLRVSLF